MQIIIDTSQPLSDTDLNVLALIAGTVPEATKRVVEEPAEKPAPARRRPATKPAPKVVEEPAEAEDDDDLLGEETVTKELLVETVSGLVASGKGKAAKAILVEAGAAKVSLLDEDKYDDVYKKLLAV